ncbi:unnamed protein product, partial [Allacma fusca]
RPISKLVRLPYNEDAEDQPIVDKDFKDEETEEILDTKASKVCMMVKRSNPKAWIVGLLATTLLFPVSQANNLEDNVTITNRSTQSDIILKDWTHTPALSAYAIGLSTIGFMLNL